MKIECDVKKLDWRSLTDDDQLAATTEALQQAEQVALKVVARPTSRAAAKTLQHYFAKDRLKPRQRKGPKPLSEHVRGGRLWEHRDKGSALKAVQPGDICVIPKDFGLLQALPSVRRFVEVAQA